MDAKRFDHNWYENEMEMCENGDYVHYEDYAALRDALENIARGHIKKPICPHMDGSIEYSNHLMSRAMMIGLAAATLRGEK
jgi:hypothetical protein